MIDFLTQIKQDLHLSGQIDALVADPESSWVWSVPKGGIVMGATAFEVTMEVRDGVSSVGAVHTADGLTFQVYKQPKLQEPPMTDTPQNTFEYKFDEGRLMEEFREYVNSTYGAHYSGKYQATDMIIDAGHGVGFCVGSIMKYARRLGKKKGYNQQDILKIMHYALILQHVLEEEGKTK